MAIGLTEPIEHPRNMFVAELGKHVGFALKGGDGLLLRIGAGETVHHFGKCTFACGEAQILSEINQFHPAAAEHFDHSVASADYALRSNHSAAILFNATGFWLLVQICAPVELRQAPV